MSENPQLTIVMGFRERGLDRVKACLDSLAAQTSKDFAVYFVDYGSATAVADATATLVKRYDFCKHLYTDTRGYPWNRSHCLNTGIRLTKTEYVMTSDIDMIYAPNFVETLLKYASPDRVIYCHPTWLEKNASIDLRKVEPSHADQNRSHKGMFQVKTEILQQVGGYDEHYCYWGLEDLDLSVRLEKLGLKEFWLNENSQTFVLHQWHPESGFRGDGIPEGMWEHLYLYHLLHKGISEPKNSSEWGNLISTNNRKVFRYLDFQSKSLVHKEELLYLELPPNSNWSVGKFTNVFDQASPGQAIAVNHAWFPRKTTYSSRFIKLMNKVLRKFDRNTMLNYARNVLHSYLSIFVLEARDLVDDYYLAFPVEDGVSIVIKK